MTLSLVSFFGYFSQIEYQKLILDALKFFHFSREDFENPLIFNEKEVKRRFNQLARMFHPDKCPGNEQKFCELTTHFGILKAYLNPKKGREKIHKKLKKQMLAIKWK